MFENNSADLVTKVVKENDEVTYEFKYFIQLNSNEKNKLKEFRENFAKTSHIHFNFDDSKFQFSQKKYFKKSQFVEDPPDLDNLENNFLNDVNKTLKQFKNFLDFEKLENFERSKTINI